MGNHRNIVDFFLHDVVTEYSANFLSRALVGVVFFIVFATTWYQNTVWYFIRGFVKSNPERFYRWIDEKWRCSRNIRPNLLLYPEGHRNLGTKPLRLRTGMLLYAYSRKKPVQLFIAMGHEGVMDEHKLVFDLKPRLILYFVAPPIDPCAFPTDSQFLQHMETQFSSLFARVQTEFLSRQGS